MPLCPFLRKAKTTTSSARWSHFRFCHLVQSEVAFFQMVPWVFPTPSVCSWLEFLHICFHYITLYHKERVIMFVHKILSSLITMEWMFYDPNFAFWSCSSWSECRYWNSELLCCSESEKLSWWTFVIIQSYSTWGPEASYSFLPLAFATTNIWRHTEQAGFSYQARGVDVGVWSVAITWSVFSLEGAQQETSFL